MIPNIFVSSTIQDLQHLRDGIRDAVVELEYHPIMSEYGEVGYLPTTSAEDSCYLTVKQCQLAVVMIGKRYGHISENGLSVTHNEFRNAKSCTLPIISLVDAEVLSFKKIYEANPSKKGFKAPGMDNPSKTFDFIDEILGSPLNNGILPFSHVADARIALKKQLAHIFGEFLSGQFDPIKAEVKDILSEIKTMRHEIGAQRSGETVGISYLKSVRFLLEDHLQLYRDFIGEISSGTVDEAIPSLEDCDSVEDFIERTTGQPPKIVDLKTHNDYERFTKRFDLTSSSYRWQISTFRKSETGSFIYARSKDGNIFINEFGIKALNSYHKALLKAAAGTRLEDISDDKSIP